MDANGGVPLPKKKKPRKKKKQAGAQGAGTVTTEQALLFEALDVLSGVSQLNEVSGPSLPSDTAASHDTPGSMTNAAKAAAAAPDPAAIDQGSEETLESTPPLTAVEVKISPNNID